jgi:hypothetical protein
MLRDKITGWNYASLSMHGPIVSGGTDKGGEFRGMGQIDKWEHFISRGMVADIGYLESEGFSVIVGTDFNISILNPDFSAYGLLKPDKVREAYANSIYKVASQLHRMNIRTVPNRPLATNTSYNEETDRIVETEIDFAFVSGNIPICGGELLYGNREGRKQYVRGKYDTMKFGNEGDFDHSALLLTIYNDFPPVPYTDYIHNTIYTNTTEQQPLYVARPRESHALEIRDI